MPSFGSPIQSRRTAYLYSSSMGFCSPDTGSEGVSNRCANSDFFKEQIKHKWWPPPRMAPLKIYTDLSTHLYVLRNGFVLLPLLRVPRPQKFLERPDELGQYGKEVSFRQVRESKPSRRQCK